MNPPQLSIVSASSRRWWQAWPDWAGVTASVGCAIHCAAMPLVIAYLPAIGLSWLAHSSFHSWMAAGCSLLAVAAFGPGWKCHRRLTPVVIGAIGVVVLTVGSFGCEEKCCASCAAQAANSGSDSAAAGDTCSNRFAPAEESSLSHWLTPLGGALLVAGHVVNHRCRCGACRSLDV